MKFFRKKKPVENSVQQELSSTDVFMLVSKDNRRLTTILLLNSIALFVLTGLVFYFRAPKIKILRMYDNPSLNETITIDDSIDNRIRKPDILLLVKFVMEHLDLKSTNALNNYDKLMSVSEDKMLLELKGLQDKVLNTSNTTTVDKVYNTIQSSTIELKKDKKVFVVTVKYQQIIAQKEGNQEEKNKEIKLAFKPVDRRKYVNDLNIGGWYYGLMLVQISDSIDSI